MKKKMSSDSYLTLGDGRLLLERLEKINKEGNSYNNQDLLNSCSNWLKSSSDSNVGRLLHAALPNVCTSFFGGAASASEIQPT